MFQPPDHYHNLSLRLSEVLSDIGVNERIVTMRRKTFKLNETIANIHSQLTDLPGSTYFFGSQAEGSITSGLQSDVDVLHVNNTERAIQEWPEWEPGKLQWLMIQNDSTSPGYCLLQPVRPDEPLPIPIQVLQNEHHHLDNDGRLLMKHSALLKFITDREVRHGPAAPREGSPAVSDTDTVLAVSCLSWPSEAAQWLQQQFVSDWPNARMKRYAKRKGCFLLPTASRTSVYPDLEWRISTSHTEKSLMLNLNITQMRCFILMKMMLKTFIDPKCKDIVSSFICKNVLFRCIADSPAAAWREPLIIPRLLQCLEALLNCILTGNCSHFIIPGNNLLAGKLTVPVKQQLAVIVCDLIQNIGQSVLRISIDNVGERLCVESGGLPRRFLASADLVACFVSADLFISQAATVVILFQKLLLKEATSIDVDSAYDFIVQNIAKLLHIYTCGDTFEQLACHLFVPSLCTQLGSLMASEDIQHSRALSHPSVRWLSLGLKSDASSSRLKFASALYCSGDIVGSETVLSAVKRQVEQSPTFSLCCCSPLHETVITVEFARVCHDKQETIIKENFMFCVRFWPSELHCVPRELRHEMFRSTQDDLPYRGEHDNWMDWAVVDSLPYLYFLQYKVYSQLQRPADQQTALDNLIQTIDSGSNLGHRETALNLLGQCMEQENRWQDALRYYMFSLNERPRNNAANRHLCRMLPGLQNC